MWRIQKKNQVVDGMPGVNVLQWNVLSEASVQNVMVQLVYGPAKLAFRQLLVEFTGTRQKAKNQSGNTQGLGLGLTDA